MEVSQQPANGGHTSSSVEKKKKSRPKITAKLHIPDGGHGQAENQSLGFP